MMQNDLIDRGALVRHLVNWQMESFSKVGHEKEYNLLDMIIRGVENEPAVYNVENVVKELEKEKEIHEHYYNISVYKHFPEVKERFKQVCIVFDKAIDIVRNGGKE